MPNSQSYPPSVPRLNDSRQVQLEVLTPLHVGAASEKLLHRGIDFFDLNDKVYIIDEHLLFQELQSKQVNFSTYANAVSKGEADKLALYLFKQLQIEPSDIARWIYDFSKKPDNQIRPFIRTGQGLPFIPGSSIKGAIMSAIFSGLYHSPLIGSMTGKDFLKDKTNKSVEANRRDNREKIFDEKNYEKELLGNFHNSIGRYVRVDDCHIKNEDLDLEIVSLYNLYSEGKNWESDWKDFSITTELAYPSVSSEFRLNLAQPLAEIMKKNQKQVPTYLNKVFGPDSFKTLFKMINDHTKRHLDREIKFFQKYDEANGTAGILDKLIELRNQANQVGENACLMRMAWGSGFHSITGDWRFSDHTYTVLNPDKKNRDTRYKSRKVGSEVLGFIKLSF